MVHQYKNNGYNILLDVNSGSVHVVDDLIYDMIPYYKEKGLEETVNLLKDKYPEQDIREAAEDLDELIKEGKLYTEDIYENYIHDIVAAKKPVVKALCLHIAHDCNLACHLAHLARRQNSSNLDSSIAAHLDRLCIDCRRWRHTRSYRQLSFG